MKKHYSKNISAQLLKERLRDGPPPEVKKEIDITKGAKRVELSGKNVHTLNPRDYKNHRKAKAIFADTVGTTSEAFFKKIINAEDFAKYQVDGAKKAIRSTDLFVAKRAWEEIAPQIMFLPNRRSKNVPMRIKPLADYMHEKYGCTDFGDVDLPLDQQEALESASNKPDTRTQAGKETDMMMDILAKEDSKKEGTDERKEE